MHKDLLLVLLLLLPQSFSIAVEDIQCTTSCGEITIGDPFRLKNDPKYCGNPNYELACINNRAVVNLYSGKYNVRDINYTNYTIKVADVGLRTGDCSSLPLRSFSCSNFISGDPYNCGEDNFYLFRKLSTSVSIVNCTKVIASGRYINASSCLDRVEFSNITSTRRQFYAMVNPTASYMESLCTIEVMAKVPWWANGNNLHSYAQIHDLMVYGFELSWLPTPVASNFACNHSFDCELSDNQVQFRDNKYVISQLQFIEDIPRVAIALTCEKFGLFCASAINGYLDPMLLLIGIGNIPAVFSLRNSLYASKCKYLALTNWLWKVAVFPCMVVKFILGAPFMMMLLIRKWSRRHLAMDQNVEEFLQSNNNFLPIRYSYSDIKKITRGLKDKLGEGGYGTVFKGRLRSGREVAIKILKRGKANGQDFISEVATIGRIHHFNVVGLIGYCFESSNQALVYDFMHNGSLDKHIFSRGEKTSLDCKEVYKIALGVARGIEYLHRGCDMQILHFDIKPHNILLDRNLIPKVSDFGVARLYPRDSNTVSLTAARGTLGYMAPELIFKNLGGISYKADVYSFGKLLMEMASGRKNVDAITECSSHIYFPLWVHDRLSEGLDVPMEEVSEENRRTIKKMMVVALWCIQLNPDERPSMRKILEMLEREVDDLQVPPKPILHPSEMSTRDDGTWTHNGKDTISTLSTSEITYEDHHFEHTSATFNQV